jgi:Na+/melibiose symporter-like transporter
MPDYRDNDVAPLDRVGFVLFSGGVALLSYVLEVFGEHSHTLGTVTGLLAISLALLGAYGWHARRAAAPIIELALFRSRTFRVSVLGGIITRIGFGGMPFLLPLLYQIGLGFAPWQAGLLTMPQALAAMGLKLISKPVLARFGHRQILIGNTLLLGCTMMTFTQIDRGVPILGIVALSLAQGFFASMQFTAMNSLVYADIDDRDASKAGSIASTAQQLALSFGVATGSLLTAWFLGHVDQTLPTETIPALHKAFLVLGATTVASSLVFIGLKSTDGNNISGHDPKPVPRGELRADSRAEL